MAAVEARKKAIDGAALVRRIRLGSIARERDAQLAVTQALVALAGVWTPIRLRMA